MSNKEYDKRIKTLSEEQKMIEMRDQSTWVCSRYYLRVKLLEKWKSRQKWRSRKIDRSNSRLSECIIVYIDWRKLHFWSNATKRRSANWRFLNCEFIRDVPSQVDGQTNEQQPQQCVISHKTEIGNKRFSFSMRSRPIVRSNSSTNEHNRTVIIS